VSFCTQCGHPAPDGERYCTACGARLHRGVAGAARLTLVGGGPSREFVVGEVERTIGRDPANDIAIDDDQLSGRHARVVRREDGFWVEDLGSTNGTFVNGKRAVGLERVRSNDLIKMGHSLLRLEPE